MFKKFQYISSVIILFFCLIFIAYASTQKNDNVSGIINHPLNIYENAGVNMFAKNAENALARIYVPNTYDSNVSVIDPATYQVINTFYTGLDPEHIVPSYDLKTLWV